MIEIFRHLALLICLLAAIATALVPEPVLLSVRPVDFAADKERWPNSLTAADQTLEEFVAGRTEGRLIRLEGEEWAAFFQAATAAAAGQPPGPDWEARLGPEFGYSRSVYFRPDEPPLAAVTGKLNDSSPFVYLLLYRKEQAQYLGVNYQRPRDASYYAPTWLMYPYRRFSLWLLLAGLVVYALLPWQKRPQGAIGFSRVRAAILPTVVGCMLAGMFFAVPLFVVPANASSSEALFSWEDGWAVLTLVCWLLALLGALILAWSAWYAGYQLLILPDRLRVTTLRGVQEYRYDTMTAVKPAPTYKPSGWVWLGSLVFILFAPRAAGPLTMLLNPEQNGVVVECRDGRRLRIRSIALHDFARVMRALEQAGVPGDYGPRYGSRKERKVAKETTGRMSG